MGLPLCLPSVRLSATALPAAPSTGGRAPCPQCAGACRSTPCACGHPERTAPDAGPCSQTQCPGQELPVQVKPGTVQDPAKAVTTPGAGEEGCDGDGTAKVSPMSSPGPAGAGQHCQALGQPQPLDEPPQREGKGRLLWRLCLWRKGRINMARGWSSGGTGSNRQGKGCGGEVVDRARCPGRALTAVDSGPEAVGVQTPSPMTQLHPGPYSFPAVAEAQRAAPCQGAHLPALMLEVSITSISPAQPRTGDQFQHPMGIVSAEQLHAPENRMPCAAPRTCLGHSDPHNTKGLCPASCLGHSTP